MKPDFVEVAGDHDPGIVGAPALLADDRAEAVIEISPRPFRCFFMMPAISDSCPGGRRLRRVP